MTRRDSPAPEEGVARSRREEALARLKAPYGEARDLVSAGHPYANLDWVLGSGAEPGRSSANLEQKMIPLFALWLQDLATEVERSLPPAPGSGPDRASAHSVRETLALRLREATEEFVAAFERTRLTR
jgi:hypothetical protein